MIATALGLLWILSRQLGSAGAIIGSMISILVIGGLWRIGIRQRRGAAPRWLPLAPLAAAGAAALLLAPGQPDNAVAAPSAPFKQPFSEERLAQLTAAGVPVFVDFTADWCLTCKVNEKVAIDRSETQAAFRRAGVVTLVGDWTRGDPKITRYLASKGRNSIPFYLFYAPGSDPQVLPQVLTPGMLQRMAEQVRVGAR